ncbi:conserved exported hypothetical protein [Tenacibaculum litopenaei]|jgi:hypothetical protein|uniref:HYC_CC_PP family protein n=1 Tax=Tenacibaculum litopenaei TaxID=396016 RepID=UPI0038934DC9
MFQVLRKITAICITFVLVFSSMSFAVEKHFCGDYLVDISYLGDADACGGEREEACGSDTTNSEPDCCKDEIAHVQGIDDLSKLGSEQQLFSPVIWLLTSSYFFQLPSVADVDNEVDTVADSPPISKKSKRILYQVYIL